jgi:hypothetical protein
MTRVKKTAPQDKDGYYCEFGYWHSYTPDAEIFAAIQEAEQLLRDPDAVAFNDIAELMADLESEGDDDGL